MSLNGNGSESRLVTPRVGRFNGFHESASGLTLPSEMVAYATVGTAGAGKTVFGRDMNAVAKGMFPDAVVKDFSNSDGYRGMTDEIIEEIGPDKVIQLLADPSAAGALVAVAAAVEEEKILEFYTSPQPDEVLRHPIVNHLVPLVSAQEEIYRQITGVSGEFMKLMVTDPRSAGIKDGRPDILLANGRSFEVDFDTTLAAAGIRRIGSGMMVCDEEAAAPRNDQTAEELRGRNTTDRDRRFARMSLPEDYPGTQHIGQSIAAGDYAAVESAAEKMGADPTRYPVSIDTGHTTVEGTRIATSYLLAGAIVGAQTSV